jgi:4-diphosphocytidyl-2-C-methyl-D-erythritol kinase
MQVFAPAKINLSLQILERRSDGFHEIETLIAPISLCDEINIDNIDSDEAIEFRCDDASVPGSDETRGARRGVLRDDKINGGVLIELEKIPHGAGLGGVGARTERLLALNELFHTNLPREALAKIAETIGSDVPFFIFQSAAVCRGRGELVSPTKLSESLSLVLLKPAFAVSTAWAYSRWRDSREIPDISYVTQHFAGQTFMNDLERPVFEKFIFLGRIKTWLLEQPEVGAALMSGSGSTVFAVTRGNADANMLAKRAKSELDPELWTCAARVL